MTEKEKQLYLDAGILFKTYGIKSMTMDDIAKSLKISKKTLYKFVSDKNDLVCKSMKLDLDNSECKFDELLSVDVDPIDELFRISEFAAEHLKSLHPSVMYDIQKYHPEAWAYFIEHKDTHIYDSVLNNMERGKQIGVFRQELNSVILAKLYVARFDAIFNPEIFSPTEYSFAMVHKEMMDYHLHGILTPKGLDIFNKKQDNN